MEFFSRENNSRTFDDNRTFLAPNLLSGVYRNYLKRLFDIVFVVVMAVPLLVIVALLAVVIGLDGANPFYLQKRVGKNGRHFKMVKLRSMVPDAEALLQEHLQSDPSARQEWDHFQKLRNDPRITRVGKLMRATSLDELPQFWNVLIGEMSLVGPRPMMPSQVELYPGLAYFDMSPGITGFWQISSRNECSFSDRAYHDSEYYKKLSLGTDIAVVLRTVTVVLAATGV